jgi:hypothetical protein
VSGELLAIGVDPGPQPGIVALRWSGVLLEWAELVQCTPGVAPAVVRELLILDSHPDLRAIVQVERFVVGRGSGKSGRAGAVTRDLVGEVQREVTLSSRSTDGHDTALVQENASRVKHWATDARLKAVQVPHSAGRTLLEISTGMRHARDAARHALFAAVLTGAVPDPLSKQAGG